MPFVENPSLLVTTETPAISSHTILSNLCTQITIGSPLYLSQCDQGCQIVLGTKYQKGKNIQNDNKIYHVAVKDLPQATQIWIFVLKISSSTMCDQKCLGKMTQIVQKTDFLEH
jgi:hypothetical protein